MRTVRNHFLFCSSRLSHQRIKMVVFVFLAFVALEAGFSQQDLAYADPEPGSNSSVGNGDLKGSHEQAFSIMQQQLRGYREKLQESERALEEFQQRHGIISIELQINFLLQQRNGFDISLKQTENVSMGLKEKLAWVKGQMSHTPQEVPLSKSISEQGIVGGAKSNLLSLQLKEQQLLTKYTEGSVHLQALRQEMAVVLRFIKEQEAKESVGVSRGKNPLYHQMETQLFQIQAELVASKAQSAVIVEQMAKVDTELEKFRSLRPGLAELQRQIKIDEVNYLTYLAKVGTKPPQDYQIQVGDQLDIKFFFNPELNESIPVRPDGRIALQLVGEIAVVGHTVEEIRGILIKNYSGQLKNPEIAVLLRSSHVLPGDTSVTSTSQTGRGGGNGN